MKAIRRNLYFSGQFMARIKAYTDRTGMKFSELVRRAVDEFLKREGA